MNKDAKIFVAGSGGLVGSAVVRQLKKQGYENLLTPRSKDVNLTDYHTTIDFFQTQKPKYVFMAAAKVGGIHANNTYRADFIHENLAIASNVIHSCYESKVTSLLFYGSSCIYPKLAAQPIAEEALLTGELEVTNRPYALAKISGIEMCDAYNRQYGTDFRAIMPSNVYGLGDNFHLENSHVLPALIRKFHEAKDNNNANVELWGSGKPKREFIYSDDLADAAIFIMQQPKEDYHKIAYNSYVNVGCGEDISIKDLAHVIQSEVGHQGEIEWNSSMPDGTMKKLMDVSRINKLGWQYKTTIEEGIQQTYSWFKDNLASLRI